MMSLKGKKIGYLQSRLLPVEISLLLLLLGIAHLDQLYGPIIMPDETGYWAAGAYFAGLDWQGIMRLSPYYGIGYGFLLAPLIALFREPMTVYHAAIIENVLFWILSYWVLRYLAKTLFPKAGKTYIDLVCFAAISFPAYLYNTQTTYVESSVVLLFLVVCAILISVSKKASCLKIVFLGICTIFLFLLHQRTIGVAIALVMVMVPLLLNRKVKPIHVLVFLITLAIAVGGAMLIKNNVIINVYQNSSHAEYNDFSQQTSKIIEMFSPEGFFKLVMNCIGRVMYLGAASLLFVYWGVFYIGRDVVYGLGLKKSYKQGEENSIVQYGEIKLFLLLCVLASIGISAISMLDGNRLDHVIYGRYSEYVIAPVIMIALLYMPKGNRKEIEVIFFSIFQLFLAIVVYIYMTGLDYAAFSPYAIAGVYGFPSLPELDEKIEFTIWISIVAILISAAVVILISNKRRRQNLRNIGVVITSITWIFVALATSQKAIYEQSDTEKAWYIFGKNAGEIVGSEAAYYVVDEEEYFTNAYWHMFRLKYFLPETELVGVSKEELEQIADPDFLLLHNTSNAIKSVGTNYVLVLQQSPFCLYANINSDYVNEHYLQERTKVDLERFSIVEYCEIENDEVIELGGGKETLTEPDSNSILINGKLASYDKGGYAIYGPYINLPAGTYRAYFTLELLNPDECNDNLGLCDVSINGDLILGEQELLKTDFHDGEFEASVEFSSGMDVLTGTEFRVCVEEGVQIRVTDISYQCVSLERQAMLPESEDYQLLRGVLDRDTDVLPVRIIAEDGLEPLLSCSQLQEALADTGREVSIVKRSELGRDPAVLLVPAEDTDLLFDLLPDFTVLVRMEEYALLVPSGYSVETAFRDVGGRPMSEGNALNLRYFLGAGEASYGNLAVNIPAGDYELRYRLSLNGTPLWSELGTLTLSGGNLSEQESLTAELFDDGYGTYENSRMLSLEESGQLRVGASVHSGVSVVGLEAYLIRQ